MAFQEQLSSAAARPQSATASPPDTRPPAHGDGDTRSPAHTDTGAPAPANSGAPAHTHSGAHTDTRSPAHTDTGRPAPVDSGAPTHADGGAPARAPSPAPSPARDPQDAHKIERLFEMTSDLLATISPEGRFTLLNPAWEKLLGWSREELQAAPIEEFMHPDDVEQTREAMSTGQSGEEQLATFTNRYRHRDGSLRWLLWSARRDEDTWYAAVKDVTDRKWLESQALHDPLTKLPNRLLLLDRASQAVTRLHRSPGIVAMLFIDLDKFKAVNDNLGHEAGDRLLVAISQRLLELMRDSDTVARLGGDEFVILAEDLEDEQEARALAQRVIDAVEAPVSLKSAEVQMLASVGIAIAHSAEADPETLLSEADVAMYRAKQAGGKRAEVFDEDMRNEQTTSVQIEVALRDAIPRDELELLYQPILPLAGGTAIGCEALVRWRPHGGEHGIHEEILLPGTFLPPAEESELIAQIGSWVLHSACMQADRWRRAGVPLPVFVNVSARELTELDLAKRVNDELRAVRLPGKALCLEVGEESVQRDPERARAALSEVKRLGVSIALDRFGSGKYALGLPSNLPLDIVKIDRGLVASFGRDKEKRAMFAATIALARQAKLMAVAVGIETSHQLALARELDCSMGQGFLLHRPTAPERLRLRRSAGTVRSAPWRTTVRLGG